MDPNARRIAKIKSNADRGGTHLTEQGCRGLNAVSLEDIKKVSVDGLLQKLSSSKDGLSESGAKERLKQCGYNEIPEKKANPIIRLMRYF